MPASTGDPVSDDRRARVKAVLDRRHLTQDLSTDQANTSWMQERFVARARALFYARMMFLTLGLLILAVPIWSNQFALTGPSAFAGYFAMLMYSIANYLVLENPRAGRIVTYVTLCCDLMIMVYLIIRGGGLQSPLLATQLLFTTLFAILFPKPLAILPPLLALLITTRIDQLLNRSPTAREVLTLLWYLALNFIIIYVLVYLNEREVAAHREVVELQGDLKELAVVEERNRLAREIHDGLGASLSSLIIQSEYILSLAKDEALLKELKELKSSAEESIEELRRNLRMMREDFDLGVGLEDYVKTFRERTQLDVRFERAGHVGKLDPEKQLALFRVLQECLSNAAKHAQPKAIEVKLHFGLNSVDLSVKDDGKGFETRGKKVGHYGLINMHERAMKVGGHVIIDSSPGKGAHISFSVPV
ncbi:MAG: sensor histidine kinase [Myxococcaceae bacterium]|nr:sensor histidine kinase [Myxococcaceae bacterium]